MENPIKAGLSILPHEKLIEILLALDDLEDIFKACSSSTIFARVCQDDYFWKLRYQQDFGSGHPSEEILKEKMPLKPYITTGDSMPLKPYTTSGDSMPLKPGITTSDPMPWREFYQLTIEIRRSSPLSVGRRHIGVIDRDGQLNMWGNNLSGRLGNGTKISTNVPQMVLSNVSQVSCGFSSTLAVTKDGKVYGWGSNLDGKLGIGSYQKRRILVPTLVKLPKKVRKIDNGMVSSIALTENGEVYAWGKLFRDPQIQTGLHTSDPIKLNLPFEEKAIDVAVGSRVFAAVTQSGKLYMWGDSRNYLYLAENWKNRAEGIYNPDNPEHRKFTQPILIPFSEHALRISMGRNHFGIVTRRGELWMAGDNYYHQIGEYAPNREESKVYLKLLKEYTNGIERDDKINIPTLIPIKLPSPVLYFNSRWVTSLVKLKDGRVLMWGDNSRGQIDSYSSERIRGIDKINKISIGNRVSKPVEIRLDHQIVYIMAGKTFTAAITDDDYVNMWGKSPTST